MGISRLSWDCAHYIGSGKTAAIDESRQVTLLTQHPNYSALSTNSVAIRVAALPLDALQQLGLVQFIADQAVQHTNNSHGQQEEHKTGHLEGMVD